MTKVSKKQVVFQGTGYRIIRFDPRNLELQLLNKEGAYRFEGYFGTIEACLAYLVYQSCLVDETILRDLKTYLKEIKLTKETVVSDIKREIRQEDENPYDDDIFN